MRASTLEHPGLEFTSPAGTTAAYVMGQFEKPNGGSAGAGNRETLAKLARLISVPDDAERADSALYAAKRKGRNCTEISGEEQEMDSHSPTGAAS